MADAQTIYDRLNAPECEAVTERFVSVMHDAASKKTNSDVTAARLIEIWQDVLTWTKTQSPGGIEV